MARLEFCQLLIEVILLARHWPLRHYHNSPIPTYFRARDIHTGRGDRLHRPGDVLLPKCGRGAGHGSYRETLLSAVIKLSESNQGTSQEGCSQMPSGRPGHFQWPVAPKCPQWSQR